MGGWGGINCSMSTGGCGIVDGDGDGDRNGVG